MKFAKPSMLSLLQLLVVSLLVAFMASPSDAMHGWKLMIRGGHGKGGGSSQAASILAAGLVVKLLSEIHKHKKVGGFAGGYELEGLGMGHGMGHGMGYGMEHGMGYGNGLGHSFQSHDAHLGHYGYEPQSHGMAWAK